MTKVDNNIISSKLFMLIPTDFSLSHDIYDKLK